MPDLSEEVRSDIEIRLGRYLAASKNYSEPAYVNSGGSAAIYKLETPFGTRAIKVYDPKFLSGANARAEERRLELQRSLIGHDCSTLVSVNSVVKCEGTAFVEMDYIAWPQLKNVLEKVPDERISDLIQQLIEAIVFLEKRDIVHRDIKPENIHISEDFARLKLIDLGVARDFSLPNEEGDDATDHGQKRPFIATAQYSSPEYLFRLDPPSPAMWKALNLYQVGAVLHDLIAKRALFQEEVEVGNRFVVARAVLTKAPRFSDVEPLRLAAQKALAMRCLVKDMNVRLQIVSWSDFAFEAPADSLSALKSKLAKGKGLVGAQSATANVARTQFERTQFAKRFCDLIRTELIAACDSDKSVRIAMSPDPKDGATGYRFELVIGPSVAVLAEVAFAWYEEMTASSAKVAIGAMMKCGSSSMAEPQLIDVAVATIDVSEELVALDVAQRFAEILWLALDLLESATDKTVLHGTDIASLKFNRG